mgnify:CR=1 FL=1
MKKLKPESNADLMTFDLSLKINQSILKSKTTIIELDKSIKINEPNEANRQKSTASYTADENRLTIDLNSLNTSCLLYTSPSPRD